MSHNVCLIISLVSLKYSSRQTEPKISILHFLLRFTVHVSLIWSLQEPWKSLFRTLVTHLRLDLTGEGDHRDEGGHKAGLQHGPVEDGAVRGAARERSHCEPYLRLLTYL